MEERGRGTCSGIRFDAGEILPRKSKLGQYLKNDDFKVDINRLIVNVASDDLDTDLEFAISDGLNVLKVNEGVQIREIWSTIDDLMEETDNRVLLYIRDAIECGHNRILLKTEDSDIIIILLGFMEKLLECNSDIKMWVKFNSGVNEKLIDMNTTFKELGGEMAPGIMFFHCLSGCDSTTAFFTKSKKVLLKSWKCYPQRTALSKVFKALSFNPSAETYKSSLPTIYEFISHDYTDEIVQLNIVGVSEIFLLQSMHYTDTSRTCTVCIRLWLEERYFFSACNGLGSRS